MRIRIVQKPTEAFVDGLDLRHFFIGCEYDVGSHLGALMLAEGWAEPVANKKSALPSSIGDVISALKRFPVRVKQRASAAGDRSRKRQRPKRK
jgi:hypothetical protein